jgi:hypothetical protein|tara:strand:+ start:268 stop:726 length:459 start_codon:yes stop_codon:yes gene_type:complete
MSQLLKKAREVFTEVQKDLKENVTPGIINTLMEDVKNAFGKLPSDDKKTLSKRYQTLLDRLKSKRKNQISVKPTNEKPIPMNAKGGSISKLKAGGFPDLSGDGKVTQKDILMGRGVVKKANGGQINGLKKMGMKVGGLAGRLAQRGYGKARR